MHRRTGMILAISFSLLGKRPLQYARGAFLRFLLSELGITKERTVPGFPGNPVVFIKYLILFPVYGIVFLIW